ncbi:unnamed protein product [Effrenium voratum]|nr:unnamed protein product [Effrenium voratum]
MRAIALALTVAAAQAPCEFGFQGSRADLAAQQALDDCVSQLLESFGLGSTQKEQGDPEQQTVTCVGIMRGLGSQFGYANNTRRVCWETPNLNLTSLSCEALNRVAWELMAAALRHLALCSGIFGEVPEALEAMADDLQAIAGEALGRELAIHGPTPVGLLISERLRELRGDLMSPLQPEGHSRQASSRVRECAGARARVVSESKQWHPRLCLVWPNGRTQGTHHTSALAEVVSRLLAFGRKAFEHANWMVWRDTHFLWLQDTLREGRVIHTAWGPADRWDELGANDAYAGHELIGGWARAPLYGFENQGSQRQDILSNLLKKIHSQGLAQVTVVEIGVFKGSLSKSLLEQLPFVQLLGVDPYVGKDGTFPGDFSETMDPDMALAQAQQIYERFPGRAQLLPVTSEEAARSIPDGSIDAIFVDGCHLYECVDSDLRTWLPKLGPGALVAGHDFSPQWPGWALRLWACQCQEWYELSMSIAEMGMWIEEIRAAGKPALLCNTKFLIVLQQVLAGDVFWLADEMPSWVLHIFFSVLIRTGGRVGIACFFALFSGLVPCQSRVLLFWSVDSGKKTQETIKANVRSVQDLGIEHDVILAHYRGSPKDWDHAWYKKHVVQSITGKGYKFHFLQQAYKEGDWEQRYEFVWALDSDIDLSKADVLQFLDLARETNSGIVGPTFVNQHGVPHSPSGVLQEHAASVIRREGHSPTRDDAGRHRLSGPQRIQMPDPGCDFRHTDFVELTAPLLKSDVLKSILLDCHGCIHEKSDWGLDMMWCKYVSERSGQGCALVDKTPVTHLDWGLAPIGQEFYMALHSVQAHYAQFWSKKQVLDCQQRSGGLVEEDDDEEDPATSKRSVRKQKKHKEMVSGDSEEGVNASVNQSAQASKPVKRSNTTRSVSKSSSEEVGQADVDEDEDLEESVDSNGLPAKNSTAKTNSTAAKVATKSRVKNSTSTKKANEKSEEQEDEDDDDDDDDDDDEEGTVDKLKQGSNSTAASQKQSNTSHTQVKSDEAKQAKVKAEDDDSDDEDEDEEDDLEPKSTLNSTQAKAAPSTPESDIFKVKAMGPGAAQAGGVIIRNGEPAQRGVSKHLGESTVMAAAGPSRDSKDAFGQQTEAEDEDLDAEDPEASPAKTRTGAVSVKIDASGRLQKVGQDETVEFQEGRQAELSSFEEAEQRLRDDIEELRKLEQELEGIRPRQGPTEARGGRNTCSAPACHFSNDGDVCLKIHPL